MPLAANLERRGAVYYWRRRLPRRLALATGRTCIKLSLQTKEPVRARFLAAQLDATASHLFMSLPGNAITKDQLGQVFKRAFVEHQAKLSRIAAFARQEDHFDPTAEMAVELARGWAYRIIATKGPAAHIAPSDEARLRQQGLDDETIETIRACLFAMRQRGDAMPSAARLTALLKTVGVEPTPGNLAQAEPAYMRALGEASVRASERYAVSLPYEQLVEEAISPADVTPAPSKADAPRVEPGPTWPVSPENSAPAAPISPPSHAGLNDRVSAVGEQLIGNKAQDGNWDAKTCRQARMIFGLFDRFLREEHSVRGLAALRQLHCASFNGFLRGLFKSYGKSPKDRERSIQELRSISASKPEDQRGLDNGTRNRHMTFLGQLLRHARKNGIVVDRDIAFTELRAKRSKRARGERPIPGKQALGTFFRSPIFTGCKDWEEIHTPGDEIYHRAAYFGPMLAYYHGLRREEFCGLVVDDVVTDNGPHPYIHVTFNEVRRIKNDQSVRNITLHPELVRLNFLKYVDAIRALGEIRLFPDLHSPSTRSPLGDRLYDELLPAFRAAKFTTHQIRHSFNNELKQRRVSEEFRADLMGHGGKTETSERYCDPLLIDVQVEELARLPMLTTHLAAVPVKLVPWVARREVAPWARARRKTGRWL